MAFHHRYMPHHHRPSRLMPSERDMAFLDDYFDYEYVPMVRVRRREPRPPPSYDVAVRSSMQCPASETSATPESSRAARPQGSPHRHHRLHHHHHRLNSGSVIKHTVTVTSHVPSASATSTSSPREERETSPTATSSESTVSSSTASQSGRKRPFQKESPQDKTPSVSVPAKKLVNHEALVESEASSTPSTSSAASAKSSSNSSGTPLHVKDESGIESAAKVKAEVTAEATVSREPPEEPQPGPSSTSSLSRPLSPRPGPSGLQQQHEGQEGLTAPDLQLDCLSSDTEGEEDVTVVKISRRRKGGPGVPKGHHSRRTTTTINAPAGAVVEVDLTQETDEERNEDEEDDIQVDAIRRTTGSLKLRPFATLSHGGLPPNVQSANSSR